jgi:hypothetical protein
MQIYILYNGRAKSWIEINVQTKELIEAKRIQEIAVDFKGMSIFCITIHWFWQWVWQILHVSLRE